MTTCDSVGDSMTTPKVSFIIPTLNRERTIEACLRSIANQTHSNKEIIIVDGGSRDETLPIASKYATKIVFDNGSLGQARQHGVEESTGEILGIFDSDIVLPTKDWTEKAVRHFSTDRNIGVVWPVNKAPEDSSIVARCYFLLWETRASRLAKQTNKKLVPGGNSLVLRNALEAAGGFDKKLKFGEDLELGSRIINLGYEVAIFEEPIIHDTMWSLKEYTKKQIWGASSLATADTTVINLCLDWSDNRSNVYQHSFALGAFGFITSGIRGMISGLARNREKSWLIFPLLLGIRVMVYGRFLIGKTLRGNVKKCPH